MRKRTLAGLSFLLSFAIVYGINLLARSNGLWVPFPGLVSHLVASLILAPILLIPVARLNRPLLAWRKERGRDIEEEEKHEIVESDIISLRPRRSDDGKLP
jgi:hypothetical protein